jgi:hypothetical protein
VAGGLVRIHGLVEQLDLLQHRLAGDGALRIASDIAPILEVRFGSRFALTAHGGSKERKERNSGSTEASGMTPSITGNSKVGRCLVILIVRVAGVP